MVAVQEIQEAKAMLLLTAQNMLEHMEAQDVQQTLVQAPMEALTEALLV